MISRSAADRSRFALRLAFTSAARVAWRLILERVAFPPGASALIPAYIGITDREGSGIGDPIEASRTPFTLYALGDRLQIDLEFVEAMLRTRRHPLMLVVHYFGIVHVDLLRLRALCDAYGTLLVEDCAHVPGPFHREAGPGTVGHAAFYSLHKSIAVPTGGVLRLNDAPFDLPSPFGPDRCDADVIEQLARTDLAAVAVARRANYQWLVKRFTDTVGVSVLYPELGSAVPHDFPLRIHGGLRERLYFALIDEGLPTIALYYHLINAIGAEDFPSSHALSRSILNLPVHQDTSIADLQHLAERLTHHLGRLRA